MPTSSLVQSSCTEVRCTFVFAQCESQSSFNQIIFLAVFVLETRVMPKTYHTYTVQFKVGVLAHRPQRKRIKGCGLHGFWWVSDNNVTKWLVSRANAHLPLQSQSTVYWPQVMCWDYTVVTLRERNKKIVQPGL